MGKQEEAIQFMLDEDYEAAAKLFVEVIEEQPDDPIAYINFGNLLVTMKEYDKAEKFYLKAIEIEEDTATAYYSLGSLYYHKELYDDAAILLQQAMRKGLDEADVYYLCGMSLLKNEHLMQALPYLQRASEMEEQAATSFQLGLVLAKLDYLNEAKEVFEKVLEIEAEHPDALYNLGVIAVHKKENKTATALFDKVIALQPTHELAIRAKTDLLKSLADE